MSAPSGLVARVRAVLGHSFVGFLAVGAAAFFFEAALLHMIVHWLGIHPIPGRCISITFSMLFTWVFNRMWSFRDSRTSNLLTEILRYFAVNGTGALTNVGSYAATLLVFPALERQLLVPMAVGSVVGLAVNYLGSRFLVFRGPKQGG